MIQLDPYDPTWPMRFEAEAEHLRAALGALALRIEHVGSTAVPGLTAKPVIDIQVSTASLTPFEPLRKRLADAGYVHVPLGDFDRVYPFFQKPADWPCTHHLHLCERGGEQEARHLAFRDQLRATPALARQYVELKQRLAGLYHGETHESRERYSLAKSSFVEAVLADAMRRAR
ncbi:GrpB family protein [Roseateles sp. MS654]|uniref:GrpB family protein n=1 Tax=Roseateles sp. MS654 TaxID=3412685 RepID=UPI003C2BB16C